MTSTTAYHEPYEHLPEETRDVHRAVATVIEELEAVDWYNQRAAVTKDPSLAAVLIHNRDEEIEHAAMALEWLRRRLPKLDEELRTYLFSEGSIVAIEEEEEKEGAERGGGPQERRDLGIGDMKSREGR